MEISIITSVIGHLIFSILMILGYKYANGNWKVVESKESNYREWVTKSGKKMKRGILIVSIIYVMFMLIQILEGI